MSRLLLFLGVVLGLHGGLPGAWCDLLSSSERRASQASAPGERGLELALKRELLLPAGSDTSRERRGPSDTIGSSFIRYGRGPAGLGDVSQPQTRSDIIIRYGRDGLNGRLYRLRQERMRRLARLALVCAAKSQDDEPASSAEERILREICKDAPLHPTVPDFV